MMSVNTHNDYKTQIKGQNIEFKENAYDYAGKSSENVMEFQGSA